MKVIKSSITPDPLSYSLHHNYNELGKPPLKIEYQEGYFKFVLRPFEALDAEAVHQGITSSLPELYPFMDWAHYPSSVQSQEQRLSQCRKDYFANVNFDLGVFEAGSNDFLMSTGWRRTGLRNPKSLEIGYWTVSKYAGKGLATLVTKILIIIGFEILNSSRIQTGCHYKNNGSQAVIRKCQFHYEGRMRNYTSEPTETMLQNGYQIENIADFYSLIPQDIPLLDWYPLIKEKILVFIQ
ncbi:MAG: Acetyltransferase including N-acetylase of ribosomal protein [Chlamydiales bacterium]|jgi:RimJ/RimL family protein N-acetyltransferase|nr:Acetyltransferase including N-acetylase of ribosomal protein [Chlamydiales bacterium]